MLAREPALTIHGNSNIQIFIKYVCVIRVFVYKVWTVFRLWWVVLRLDIQGNTRRVQRLGSSSLVVTLPKSWVKAVGLKPGDRVVVVQEGMTLRIVPARDDESGMPVSSLDASRLGDREVQRLLWCFYVLGNDSVDIRVSGREQLRILREAASGFVGLEVAALGDDVARLNVLIDSSRLDVKSAIKGIAVDVDKVVDLFRRAVEGEEVNPEEIARIRGEVRRSLSMVERYLVNVISTEVTGWEAKKLLSMMIAANFFGLSASEMLDAAALLSKLGAPRDERIKAAVEKLTRLVPLVGVNIANPSLKRGAELMTSILEIKASMEAVVLDDSSSKEDVYAAARITEIIRLLLLAVNVMYCVAFFNTK